MRMPPPFSSDGFFWKVSGAESFFYFPVIFKLGEKVEERAPGGSQNKVKSNIERFQNLGIAEIVGDHNTHIVKQKYMLNSLDRF